MTNRNNPMPPPPTEGPSIRPALCFCVLASGSKGNAIYVTDGTTHILFDAGLSGKEIARRMASRDLDPTLLNALVVSHEHSDHLRGVGVMSRRHKLPVYSTAGTLSAGGAQIGKLHETVLITCGEAFSIGGLRIHPFSTSHDARDPVGFTVSAGDVRLGIATDLGIVTHMVRTHLGDCDALILEANHCPVMLETGPYPWPLKQRIKGRSGHLSNEAARDLAGELSGNGLRQIVLAHLSEENNTPEKAANVVAEAIRGGQTLSVACQHESTPVFCIPHSDD